MSLWLAAALVAEAHVLWVAAALCVVTMLTGCLNLGGGRQVVPLPWSQPAIVMDGTGVQMKAGRASGAVLPPDGSGSGTARADQYINVSGDLTSQRSTDASLADEASQASGRESPGGATDSSTGKEIRGPSLSGSASVAPGGVAITAPAPAASTTAPVVEDIAALEDAIGAAQQAVDMLGSGGGENGADTPQQAKAKAWLASLQARLAKARQ